MNNDNIILYGGSSMNNKKIIEALNVTINGLTMLRDELMSGNTETPNTHAETPKTEVMNPPVEETTKTETTNEVDVESLKKMKYNDFKKYASKLGVDCKGTRDEIMDRVLAKLGESDDAEEEVEDTPTKSANTKPSKKIGKAKVEEPEYDEYDEQAKEIAESTDVEDIISALADVDVKATKKNAVDKLAYALREGLIELDDDNENEDDEEDVELDEEDVEVEDSEDEDEITADTYTENFDPQGYNDPTIMSSARKRAIKEKMQSILDAIENEDITEDDITSYIEDNTTEDEIELLGDDYEDEDLIRFYMELVKRTIDNDGDEHEPSDPYEIDDNETNFCCGHELKYSKKNKKFICEICGEEYEVEE